MIASVVPAPSVPAGIAYTSDSSGGVKLRSTAAAADHPGCGPAAGRPARARRPRRRPARPARTARRCAAGPAARPGREPAATRPRTARTACATEPATRIRRDAGSTRTTSGSGALDRGPDQLDVGRVGAVPLGQLGPAQPAARQRGASPQDDRDLDPLARVDRTDDLGARNGRPYAAGDPYARFALHSPILPQGRTGRRRQRDSRPIAAPAMQIPATAAAASTPKSSQ